MILKIIYLLLSLLLINQCLTKDISNDELEKEKIWERLINPDKTIENYSNEDFTNIDDPILGYSDEIKDELINEKDNSSDQNNTTINYIKSELSNFRNSRNDGGIYQESIIPLKEFDPNILTYFGSENRNIDKLILKQNQYGTKIIEDQDLSEVLTKKPEPAQTSLVIVFDGTGSMLNDLNQLTIGAEAIIDEITQRANNPIYNYVFVPFRDPYVGPKLVTENQNKLLHELKTLRLFGGGDCPESAIGGINLALESALPKSLIYVFTDATARDFGLDKTTIDLIQEKQATLTFLLTGFCGSKSTRGYYVYEQLAALSNGQVYNLQKHDIKDVLESIKQSLDTNLIPLNYIYSNDSGSQTIQVDVDQNLKEFTVSVAGEKPNITVTDPNDVRYVEDKEILNLDNLKIVNVQDPQPGKWNVHTEADSEHSVRLTALSDLNFNFGFSLKSPKKIEDTNLYPIKRVDNYLGISTSNDSLIQNLTTVQLVLINSENNPENKNFEVSLPLTKVGPHNEKTIENSSLYISKPFPPPLSLFKIYVNGFDKDGNPLKHLLSTAIKAIDGEIPRVSVLNNYIELNEGEDAILNCKVEASVPTLIHWIRNKNEIYEGKKSSDGKVSTHTLKNVQMKDSGKYVCQAVNVHGRNEKEINLIVKPHLIPLLVKMMEPRMVSTENDVDYQISCFVQPTQNVTLIWLFNNKPINNIDMEIVDNNLVINKVNRIHSGDYTCTANNGKEIKSDSAFLDVYYEPKILGSDNERITTYFGKEIIIPCDTIGNPLPKISWTLVKTSDDPEMKSVSGVIQKFSPHDEGIYICEVSNGIGNIVQKEIYIDGKAGQSPEIIKPEFTVIERNLHEDLSLICECKLCGPISNYSWAKYDTLASNDKTDLIGKVLYPENRYKNFSYGLEIKNIKRDNQAFYKCRLYNEHGFDEMIIELRVLEKPSITAITYANGTELPENNIVKISPGGSLEIICNVKGNPSPKIDWTKDNIPIIFTENIFVDHSRITITGTKIEDAGEYECQTTNTLGRATRKFELLVVVPPILKVPDDTVITVEKGHEVRMNCEVTGIPPPTVTWFLNDKRIDDNNEYYTIDGTILRFVANFEDNGFYNCVAENEGGNIAKPFLVVVFVPPKILNSDDEIINVKWNEPEFTLECDAEGYPSPHTSWAYNGNLIQNSSNHLITETGKLIVKNMNKFDNGVFVCEVMNNFGIAEKSFYLSVKEPPRIISSFNQKYTLLPNDSFGLECNASGNPEPEIYWRKYENTLEKENRKNILEFGKITAHDSGIYDCVASNSVGKDRITIEIKVLESPQLKPDALSKTKIYSKESSDLTLECPFTNMRNASWYKNGYPFYHSSEETVGRLVLPIVMLDDRGNYTCFAENEVGTNNFTQEVIVMAPPRVDMYQNFDDISDRSTYPNIISTIGENVNIKCPIEGFPIPKIIWKKDNIIISMENVLNLTDVQEINAGQYICYAENSLGSTEILYNLHVEAPPTTHIPPINWVESREGEDLALDCTIYGIPTPIISWTWDNKLIDGHDSVLELKNLGSKDRGAYKCSGRNPKGVVHIEYRIDVLEGPKFIYIPNSVSIIDTEDLTLRCTVQGNPLPILAWTFNGKMLLGTSRIHNFDKEKAESFEVIDIDKYGNVVSSNNQHNEIAIYNQNSNNNINDLYGKVYKDNGTITLMLIIKNKRQKISGSYTCHAINSLGNNEQQIGVEVFVSPILKGRKIDKELFLNITLLEGLPLILSCAWHGFPIPNIEWFKNDIPLRNSEHLLSYDKKILTILITKMSDSGRFTCRASNKAGYNEKYFMVDILSPPTLQLGTMLKNSIDEYDEMESSETALDVPTGEKVVLECPVSGNPNPSVFWVEQFDNSNDAEVLVTNKSQLVLDEIKESGIYTCYANNTLGFLEKKYRVQVLKIPRIEEIVPNNYNVKEYQTISLYCPVVGDPLPHIMWYKDGHELKQIIGNFYLSQDKTNLKIPNSKSTYSGIYTCRAKNMLGSSERDFNVTVTTPVKWSEWSSWSPCSKSCGGGLKTRTRHCLQYNGDNAMNDLKKCVGKDFQSEPCDILPCPIDGKWSKWSGWTSCSKSCWDVNDKYKPTKKRYRECNSPAPANGGKGCVGVDYEEVNCNENLCSLNGGWSGWTPWSPCSVSCGNGFSTRYRECNNPVPLHGGKVCAGSALESQVCYAGPCPIHGGWSDWSSWSECSQTCGSGFKKRKRSCTNPEPIYGGLFCLGDNVEVMKCKLPKCKNSDLLRNIFPQQTFTHYSSESSEDDFVILDNTKQGFSTGPNPSSAFESNEEDSGDADFVKTGGEVVVKVENLMPIHKDISEISFHPARAPLTVTRVLPCQAGFKKDAKQECVDINECDESSICGALESCVNTIGSYYCMCRSGFNLNENKQKCEDINECEDNLLHGCSHGCKNSLGSYYCICPVGYSLASNEKNCVESSKDNVMSDHATDFDRKKPKIECPEGFYEDNGICIDNNECETMEHDCGSEQSCLNTNGTYLCVPTACPEEYVRDETSGQCILMCNDEALCTEGAKISQTLSYTLLTLNELKESEAFLKIVNYDINRIALPETIFSFERGRYSNLFRLESVAFKKGIAYLYGSNRIKSERLYNVKVKARSFDPNTFELLYVTKFVIYLYVL